MNHSEAQRQAQALIQQHLPGWGFRWSNAKTIMGSCKHDAHIIKLSWPLVAVAGEAEVLDTILHEIAHGKVGPGHGHGPVWKREARALGCSAARCHSVKPKEAAWMAKCGCGQIHMRHKRSKHGMDGFRCKITKETLRYLSRAEFHRIYGRVSA